MKILIDGDSCNVIPYTEKIAKRNNIMCHIYCDTSRLLESEYSEIHIVDKGKDSADFAILNKCGKHDVVVTNDSGLAAMVLAKQGYAINSHGFEYTKGNIDSYLNRRHLRNITKRRTNKQKVVGIIKPNQTYDSYSTILKSVIQKGLKKGYN